MAGTTRYYDAGVSPAVDVYVERQMLKYAQPVLVLEKTGPLIKPMPKNAGMSIDFRRPKIFSPATTPLMEGVTPSISGVVAGEKILGRRKSIDMPAFLGMGLISGPVFSSTRTG